MYEPKTVGESSYTVPAVIIFFSNPADIEAIGFIDEPGCFGIFILLRPVASTSVPNPPTHPTTFPVL